jgi:endonuclease-3
MILDLLRKECGEIILHEQLDRYTEEPFKLLIATILSQNTSDVNSARAFKMLEDQFEVSAKTLADADEIEIESRIRMAGLGNIKAKRIKSVSKRVAEEFNGDLKRIFDMQLEEARDALLQINGIGYKTADIVLAFAGGKPIVPIDTHLFKLANRLGISDSESYRDVQVAFSRLIPPERMTEAHLLLLALGKNVCHARRPKCESCPIQSLCTYQDW